MNSPRLWAARGPAEPRDETYLGDGVYACHDGYQVWLSIGDGSSIALDPDVIDALVAFNKRRLLGVAS